MGKPYREYTPEDIYNMRFEITTLRKQLDQLKAENEELKKQNNQLDNGINEQFSKIVELEGRNNLLKVILTEIKEIAETAAKCLYTTKSDDYTDGYRWLGSIILQKISEVE